MKKVIIVLLLLLSIFLSLFTSSAYSFVTASDTIESTITMGEYHSS